MNKLDKWETATPEEFAELTKDNAQLRIEIEQIKADNAALREALQHADTFIENGVAFGYIRLPDSDLDDLAIKGIIRKALASDAGADLLKEVKRLRSDQGTIAARLLRTEKALELAIDLDALKFCAFNGVKKERWPDYCSNPPETKHSICVRCWKEYYLAKAMEVGNISDIPDLLKDGLPDE